MMSRVFLNLAVVFLGLLALSVQVKGSCSQYGHSCFGAHGKKRFDPQQAPQYPSLEDVPAYPPALANQLVPSDAKVQEEGLLLDEPAISNREIITNVRNWLSILARRLRQKGPQSASPSSAQNYGYFQ